MARSLVENEPSPFSFFVLVKTDDATEGSSVRSCCSEVRLAYTVISYHPDERNARERKELVWSSWMQAVFVSVLGRFGSPVSGVWPHSVDTARVSRGNWDGMPGPRPLCPLPARCRVVVSSRWSSLGGPAAARGVCPVRVTV